VYYLLILIHIYNIINLYGPINGLLRKQIF